MQQTHDNREHNFFIQDKLIKFDKSNQQIKIISQSQSSKSTVAYGIPIANNRDENRSCCNSTLHGRMKKSCGNFRVKNKIYRKLEESVQGYSLRSKQRRKSCVCCKCGKHNQKILLIDQTHPKTQVKQHELQRIQRNFIKAIVNSSAHQNKIFMEQKFKVKLKKTQSHSKDKIGSINSSRDLIHKKKKKKQEKQDYQDESPAYTSSQDELDSQKIERTNSNLSENFQIMKYSESFKQINNTPKFESKPSRFLQNIRPSSNYKVEAIPQTQNDNGSGKISKFRKEISLSKKFQKLYTLPDENTKDYQSSNTQQPSTDFALYNEREGTPSYIASLLGQVNKSKSGTSNFGNAIKKQSTTKISPNWNLVANNKTNPNISSDSSRSNTKVYRQIYHLNDNSYNFVLINYMNKKIMNLGTNGQNSKETIQEMPLDNAKKLPKNNVDKFPQTEVKQLHKDDVKKNHIDQIKNFLKNQVKEPQPIDHLKEIPKNNVIEHTLSQSNLKENSHLRIQNDMSSNYQVYMQHNPKFLRKSAQILCTPVKHSVQLKSFSQQRDVPGALLPLLNKSNESQQLRVHTENSPPHNGCQDQSKAEYYNDSVLKSKDKYSYSNAFKRFVLRQILENKDPLINIQKKVKKQIEIQIKKCNSERKINFNSNKLKDIQQTHMKSKKGQNINISGKQYRYQFPTK